MLFWRQVEEAAMLNVSCKLLVAKALIADFLLVMA
jgi:hypothetical protein